MSSKRIIGLAWLGLLLAQPLSAQEVLELEAISIIGNPELPKTLVLVPWKRPLPGELTGQPEGSLLRETLAPIDPPVFRREVQYYQAGFAIE